MTYSNKGRMAVICASSKDTYWYADKVGEAFEIAEEGSTSYGVLREGSTDVPFGYIDKVDCNVRDKRLNDCSPSEWSAASRAASQVDATPEEGDAAFRAFREAHPSHICETQTDVVNSPDHYNKGGVECIDYLRQQLTEEQFKGYLLGNVHKYTHRWQYKNGKEDLEKAQWYLNRLIGEEL